MPTEILERGFERWIIKPKRKFLRWLIGEFEIIDCRKPILAREYNEILALYYLEREERERKQEEF
ncbi:MAG: hypothetical protein QXN68_00855 [Thermoplasmata archaeon]